MAGFTTQHLTFITEKTIETKSPKKAQRAFQKKFRCAAPSRKIIQRCLKNFYETGSVHIRKNPGPSLTVRTSSNIEKVKDIATAFPQKSLRRISQEVGISVSSTYKIMKKNLSLIPYKIRVVQQLLPPDYLKRKNFAAWFIRQCQFDSDFLHRILYSDKAHFHLNGCVNKQNSRFWSIENPEIIKPIPLHSKKVTVWCAISSREIVGPYFFEDSAGNTVTVTSERYTQMLREYFFPIIEEKGMGSYHFQQDGATSHTARVSMALLREKFPGKLISRFGEIDWPPRSPDLTPLDFYLWGYLKSKVYEEDPRTVEDLKRKIQEEITRIHEATLRKIMESTLKRMQECLELAGAHLKCTIFKK